MRIVKRANVLKRTTTGEQARALVQHLRFAEDELGLMIAHTRGLTLVEADKIATMASRLRALRYAIEIERRFEWRDGSFWTWNARKGDWEREPAEVGGPARQAAGVGPGGGLRLWPLGGDRRGVPGATFGEIGKTIK